jgi:hypothetical protein
VRLMGLRGMDGYMSGVYGWSYRAVGNGMKLLWGVVSQINGSTSHWPRLHERGRSETKCRSQNCPLIGTDRHIARCYFDSDITGIQSSSIIYD